jgi:hypothetical protein
MQLLAFPRGRSAARMGAGGERLHSVEGRGSWTLVVRGARRRSYQLQAGLTALRASLRPRAVLLDGRPLPAGAWEYDASARTLRVRFQTVRGRLHVSG